MYFGTSREAFKTLSALFDAPLVRPSANLGAESRLRAAAKCHAAGHSANLGAAHKNKKRVRCDITQLALRTLSAAVFSLVSVLLLRLYPIKK